MFSNEGRKVIFLFLIVIVLGSFALALQIGKSQDEMYALEQTTYSQAEEYFSNEQYKDALTLTRELIKRQPNSHILNYLHAMILTNVNDFPEAKLYFEKTLKLNPHLVESPLFMLNFGESLMKGNFVAEAIIVMEKCLELDLPPEEYPDYQQKIREHLENLKFVGGK